jgi:cytochrome P450
MEGSNVFILLTTLLLLRILYEYLIRDRSLPPGPRRLPLIGNLHQASKERSWQTFEQWTKKYGPIVSAQLGGNTVIILGNAAVARDLLDRRGSIYSDRPRMVMAGENLTKGMHLLLRPFNERYRLHQRMHAPILSPRASPTYYPFQDLESKQVLYDFLSSNDFKKQFDRYAGSLVYALAYGFRVPTGDGQALADAHLVEDNFAYAAQIGTWIVDALPFLNVLPAALAPWKRISDKLYKVEESLHLQHMEYALSTKSWNWMKECAVSKEAEQMTRIELAYNLGIVADAGLDTTAAQMQVFVLAALCYPAFIEKAQKELDEVIGPDRLPGWNDKKQLPYIDAIVEETLRWRSIIPGGIPHATLQEDTYMGYRIPKGVTVLPLNWAMSMNDQVFDNPDDFLPERWLEKPENADERFVNFFGYGRRVCTGRHIARNSLFLLTARVLWGFNIKHAVDQNGKKKEVDSMAFSTGFLARPLPFEAVFESRSAHAKAIIEKEWETAEKDVDVILNSIREQQISMGFSVRAKSG